MAVIPFDYVGMLNDASELIEEFGQIGQLLSPGTKSGDAWNPTIGPPVSTNVRMVETDYTQKEIESGLVLATDKQILIDAKGLAAEIVASATEITYNGKTFQIIGPVKQINPAGINLLWIAQGRA